MVLHSLLVEIRLRGVLREEVPSVKRIHARQVVIYRGMIFGCLVGNDDQLVGAQSLIVKLHLVFQKGAEFVIKPIVGGLLQLWQRERLCRPDEDAQLDKTGSTSTNGARERRTRASDKVQALQHFFALREMEELLYDGRHHHNCSQLLLLSHLLKQHSIWSNVCWAQDEGKIAQDSIVCRRLATGLSDELLGNVPMKKMNPPSCSTCYFTIPITKTTSCDIHERKEV